MIKILVVLKNGDLNSDFINTLSQVGKTMVRTTETGTQALEFLGNNSFDLAVTSEVLSDMTGIEFAKKLLTINPMINTAIVSDLPKEDFHEATEGMGVLMAIPSNADKKEALSLVDYLDKILQASSQ